jgi:hypothetical protein
LKNDSMKSRQASDRQEDQGEDMRVLVTDTAFRVCTLSK